MYWLVFRPASLNEFDLAWCAPRRFATLSALHSRCVEVAADAAAAAQARRAKNECDQEEDPDDAAVDQASSGACSRSVASPKSVVAAPGGKHCDPARSVGGGLGWGHAAMCFDVHG